jgi:hypothetical protein
MVIPRDPPERELSDLVKIMSEIAGTRTELMRGSKTSIAICRMLAK